MRGRVWERRDQEKGGGGECRRGWEKGGEGECGRGWENGGGESVGEAGRREEGRVWEGTGRAGWWVRQYSLRSVMTFQHFLHWNIIGHFAT